MNDITIFSNLPAYIKNQGVDALTKTLTGGTDYKRISIKGGVFRMVVSGKEVAKNEDRAMDLVIVNAAATNDRQYYAGAYVEGSKSTPACWSRDGQTPDPDARMPQHANCVDCPQNKKGTGANDSRACKYHRQLAVVLAGDMGGPVYNLSLPAMSIFGKAAEGKMGLNAYAQYLAAHSASVGVVVTEARFDTTAQVPKLTFKPKRALTEEEFMLCKEQGASQAAIDAITLTIGKNAGEEEAVVAEEEPQPTVVKNTKAAPAAKGAVEATLTKWAQQDAAAKV